MSSKEDGLSRVNKYGKNKNGKKKKKSIWKRILLIGLLLIGAVGLAVVGLFTYYIATAPDLDPEMLDVPFASQFYDKDGTLIAVRGDENRIKITYDDLPQNLIDALTATEDVRFFDHPGIDIRRILGAVVGNVRNGFGSEGASTITQQVVENMFLTPDKKISLKVQEQWLALQLEKQYSKEEILEMYLNKIYFGSGAYGVGKAAEVYFGIEDLNELSLVQAAILAGLPQRPHAYNPFENPELMQERVDTVYKLMVRHGKITQEEADEAKAIDVSSVLTDKKPATTPYQAFIQQVEVEIDEKIPGANIDTDGLIIHTTLDTSAQQYVEHLLTDSAENPMTYPDDDLQAGISVVDTKTGAIRAIGGRRNSESNYEFNHAIQLKRQGGSVVKPIISYGPAIEFEKYSTYTQILDENYTPEGSSEIRNASRKEYGWVTMRYALTHSLNVPAAKTLVEVGSDKAKPFAEGLGLEFVDKTLDPRDAIGGTGSSITPLELAGAYSAFGNEGIYNEPFAVSKVEFADGSVIDLKPKPKVAMSDYTAFMITDMLKSVVNHGTGQSANVSGLPMAGKTGTTNIPVVGGAKDSWFAGYTTNYSIGIWSGYSDAEDNERPLTNTKISQELFKHTMTELSKDVETADFVQPNSVVKVGIEKGTNPPELASEFTPKDNIVYEYFVKGTEPVAVSENYTELSPVSNLSASYNETENQIDVSWDYPDLADNISFEINYQVNDGEMKLLMSTSDLSIALTDVDKSATYTIQVVTVDSESDKKSEPATVSLVVQATADKDELPAVTNLVARFEEENSVIDVTWNYNGPENVVFEIKVGDDLQTVASKGVRINGAEAGKNYDIMVTPISSTNKDNRGKVTKTSIVIPKAENPVEPSPPAEPDEPDIPLDNGGEEENTGEASDEE